jgi:UDP-glucose 4-epimerase
MSRILIAGGAGFLGSNLADSLLHLGHAVHILDRRGARCLLPDEIRERIVWHEGDFSDPSCLQTAASGQDIVFHLISTTLPKSSNQDPAFDFASNVVGTIHLLEAAKHGGARKVIFASSGGTVYGLPQVIPIPENHPTEPLTSYGITKLAIEKYLALFRHEHGLEYTVLRMGNPYGRYQWPLGSQGAIAVFIWRALKGQTIDIWGDGELVRDYIHVFDVVEAMIAAMDRKADSQVFNVGSGQGHSLNDVVMTIEHVVGHEVAVQHSSSRSLDTPANVLDISKIRSALGWQPKITFAQGIQATVETTRALVASNLQHLTDLACP